MARFRGFGEQYDGGRAIVVQQEGAHVVIAVEAGQDSREGRALVTPGQAWAISTALADAAKAADQYDRPPKPGAEGD